MRSMWIVWLSCLACWADALFSSPSPGRLLVFDDFTRQEQSAARLAVSPEAARLIIASRLGVGQYHEIGDKSLSRADYDNVNIFASRQQMFSNPNDQHPTALVVLQGHDIKAAVSGHAELELSSLPSIEATDTLLADLILQVMAKDSLATDSTVDPTKLLQEGAVFTSKSTSIRKLTSAQDTDPASLIASLIKADYDVLVLVTSDEVKSAASYGSWTLPLPDHMKRDEQEKPLEPPHSTSKSSARPSSSPDYDQSTPLRGILPNCYASLSACQSSTRNCTGHGTCLLKFTNKDTSETSGSRDCYACACKSQVRTNADGSKKTTSYGGPACQKKDIVAPFWLIAGFSVLMVSLVAWGIGTIWSMGEEQLPSVIGAGVSGPPRR